MKHLRLFLSLTASLTSFKNINSVENEDGLLLLLNPLLIQPKHNCMVYIFRERNTDQLGSVKQLDVEQC